VTNERGVVFDLDGVLVDSEPLHLRAFQEILAERGKGLSRDEYYTRYLVYSDREVLAQLLPGSPGLDTALAEKQERYLELLMRGIPAFPDGLALLGRTNGWRVGLATGSRREEAERCLRSLGVLERFHVLVTSDDCRRGKPDPEPYLLAAAGLGLQPGACVAIEDAPGGIRAAKTAGMLCVAVTHSCPADRLTEADLVVDDLTQVDLAAVLAGSRAS
jgi:HAD superfamily hydrolase (TIGR01509 family)